MLASKTLMQATRSRFFSPRTFTRPATLFFQKRLTSHGARARFQDYHQDEYKISRISDYARSLGYGKRTLGGFIMTNNRTRRQVRRSKQSKSGKRQTPTGNKAPTSEYPFFVPSLLPFFTVPFAFLGDVVRLGHVLHADD